MAKFEAIILNLKKEPFLKDFIFRKRDASFINKFEGGCYRIELEHWTECGDLYIRPLFAVRFDFAHKWFEKFSFKDISVQRDNYVVGYQGEMLGYKDVYTFKDDSSSLIQEYIELSDMLKKCSSYVFKEYATPRDVYNNKILPLIDGKIKMPEGGIDWFFEYLTICKVIAPKNYDKLKEMLLRHADWRMTHYRIPEPNMAYYYDHLDEIFGFLESLSVDDLLKRERYKKR